MIDGLSNLIGVGFVVMEISIFIKSLHLQIIVGENSQSKDLPQPPPIPYPRHLVVDKWSVFIML